jgi:hypothetical protein
MKSFLRKARLCLCFFWPILLTACSVLSRGTRANAPATHYRVTLLLLPGYDPDALQELSGGPKAAGPDLGRRDLPGEVTYMMIVRDEESLTALRRQLSAAGIIVKQMVLLHP